MKNSHYNFIIILLIIVLFGGVYSYFVSDLKSEAASSLGSTSDLSSTADATSAITDENFARDTAFLSTVGALNKIKIDTSIFEDPAFKALNYNVVTIDTVTPGRENPFSPVVGSNINTTTSPRVKFITN